MPVRIDDRRYAPAAGATAAMWSMAARTVRVTLIRARSESAVALRPYYEAMLADEAMAAAEIAVEQVKGPILMVSGEADAMWPATELTQIAERRAADRGFRHELTHLRYPAAGHLCGGVPGTPVATEIRHPLTGQVYDLGGTPAANAHARADSWPRVIQFLHDMGEG